MTLKTTRPKPPQEEDDNGLQRNALALQSGLTGLPGGELKWLEEEVYASPPRVRCVLFVSK